MDLVAKPGTYLEGQVVDAAGAPTPHAPLTYRALLDDVAVHARADRAGRFRLGPMGPGPHEVTALADRAQGHAGSAPALVAGVDQPLQLVVRSGVDLHVSGVREDDGRLAPLVSAFVTRVGEAPDLVATHRSKIGKTTLTLGPVQPGTLTVAVATRDGWCGVLEGLDVPAGTEPPDRLIPLSPGARLTLQARGEDTLTVRVLAGAAVVESVTLPPGEERHLVVPATRLVVEAHEASGEVRQHALRLEPSSETLLALPR